MNRILLIAGLLCAVLVAVSCGENLDAGTSCPSLCPEQSLPIQDVVLDAVTFDTTVGTFPVLGNEPGLVLASRGDTLDVRAVARYDSVPGTYSKDGTSHNIVAIDSARVFVRFDTTAVNFTGTITLQVFDVDTTAADSNTAAVIQLFRPDRLLGSLDIERTILFLQDTVSVAIPNSFVLARILSHGKVRIGFRMIGTGDLTMLSAESGLPPALKFDPAPGDTSVASFSMGPLSNTPTTDLLVANDLRDYSLLVKTPPAPTERIVAGGLPAYRAYIQFVIPPRYLDSVVVVRAQLSLVQRPLHTLADGDLATIYPVVVSTGTAVTDYRRAAQLAYPASSYGVLPMVYAPKDSGERIIDLVQLFRQWSALVNAKHPIQTAIVLRGANEGRAPGRLAFYGLDAPAALRPRLRLSFLARARFGIP